VDEQPEQIEDHIRTTRRELGSNLQELEHRVKDATNWRVQFDRHPGVMLGIALAGGILLSAGLSGRSRRTATVGGGASVGGGARISRATGEASDVAAGVWDGVKGALIGAASTQIRSVLSELVPGFREHEHNADRSSGPSGRSKLAAQTPVADAVAADRSSESPIAH
jgi:hypothetical protein